MGHAATTGRRDRGDTAAPAVAMIRASTRSPRRAGRSTAAKVGVAFKAPKTRAGVRDVTLPDVVVDALREHRRQQLEQRMAMGLGKPPDDALVFSALDGGPSAPRQLSGDWREVRELADVGDVTWHALRHTHVSMLIDAGIDVGKIAKRIGHANPSITLKIYAKEFRKRDEVSAAAINAAVANLGGQ